MNDYARDALGYSQLTGMAAATALSSIPAGTTTVLLQAEAQVVRYRDDGTNPSGTVGMNLIVGVVYEFTIAQISRMRFIEAAGGAILNVSFYGTKTA